VQIFAQEKNGLPSDWHYTAFIIRCYITKFLVPNMTSILPLQAGLAVGDLILAVNKDTLLGSTYDAVSIYL